MNDLISRQAVIDMVKGWNLNQHIMNEEDALDDVNVLPSAEPERKKGKWIGKEQFANSPEFYSWQCSVCGCVLEDPTLGNPYPFCPNCGSYNGGEEDEN